MAISTSDSFMAFEVFAAGREDVERYGREEVVLMIASENRDEQVFDAPETFRAQPFADHPDGPRPPSHARRSTERGTPP